MPQVLEDQAKIPTLIGDSIDTQTSGTMALFIGRNDVWVKENFFCFKWCNPMHFKVINVVIIPDKKSTTAFY
jgi:hypothetical protein